MAELEAVIEQKLIEQLIYGDSQWIYRNDLKTEEDLWNNFKYILEQNNKERLNGEHLSDSEFEQVKNQLQFSSFYKAGAGLVMEMVKSRGGIFFDYAQFSFGSEVACEVTWQFPFLKQGYIQPALHLISNSQCKAVVGLLRLGYRVDW